MSLEIDKNLIEKSIEGDSTAFSEIYFLLRNRIFGFAYRMLNDSSVAEDITQEVFIFFIQHPRKFSQEHGSLHSFLCGVARNKIMHHLRNSRNKTEIFQDDLEDFNEPKDEIGCDPLKNMLNAELAEKVQDCIAKLSPLYREVILLREIQELSYDEIVKITESDLSAVKVRLYRARKKLTRLLTPYLTPQKKEKCYEVR